MTSFPRLRIVCIGLVTTVLTGCPFTYDPPEDVDARMTIRNNSNSYVYYLFSDEDSLRKTKGVLPFNIFKRKVNGKAVVDTLYYSRIAPNELDTVLHFQNWEDEIKSYPDKQLRIFFFEKPILEKYSWEEIADMQLYSDMKRYSLEDLNRMNWRIEVNFGELENVENG